MHDLFDQAPSFLDLGAWTAHLIRPLFYFFKDDNVAPALALLIFGVAVGLCILFLVISTYIRIQIRRRTSAVRRAKDKNGFAKGLSVVEKIMTSSGYLRHSWKKFRETLLEPSAEEESDRQVVFYTTRPQSYFNTSEAGLRFALFRACPNLLVGIGLLLTFFGLVTALYFTSDAIENAQDLHASQEALENLLHAASFKFYTSIAGLGGSIILTVILRYGISKIESSFDSLASALEAKLEFITSESIAFDQYKEAKEQTRNLKLFNTEVAISVGRHVEQAISSTLPNFFANAMAPIAKTLEQVAQKLTSVNEEAISKLAGTITERLDGSTGEQLKSLSKTLAELRESLGTINSRLDESGTGLANNLTKSSQEMLQALGAIKDTANAMQAATSPLGESARQMADASGHILESNRAVQVGVDRAQTEFRDVANILRSTLEATTKSWENYDGRFSEVNEELGRILDRILRSVQENLEALRGFMEKIDAKLSGAVDRLGGGIDELTEFAQQMEQVTARLNGGGNGGPRSPNQ
jgi:septation ring formation regulator EzrA